MNDDKLTQAIRSLRHYGDLSTPNEIESDRQRILSSLGAEKRRSHKRWTTFWIPLAAVFIGSTAWAAASGRLPTVWKIMTRPFTNGRTIVVSQVTTRASTLPVNSLPVAPPTSETKSVEEKQDPVPSVGMELASVPVPSILTPKQIPTKKTSQPEHTTNNSAVDSSASESPIDESKTERKAPSLTQESEDLSLYKKAHNLHFNQRHYAHALQAWDEYLQNMPTGIFVTEARYNRAICLVRLGRYSESKMALQPFASGSMGGYRQREAQELLDTVNQKQSIP